MATIASDSRVSLIDLDNNPIQWFDRSDLKKNLSIDGALYGFAGVNWFFQVFLESYTTKEESIPLLDSLMKLAQQNNAQIFILRHADNELRLFANSPKSDLYPEIYKVSTDNVIDKTYYAIGSGKEAKQYKKNKRLENARIPISRIIQANTEGLRKSNLLYLNKKASEETITRDEAMAAVNACLSRGGDLFTGGDIFMSQTTTPSTIKEISEQVAISKQLNKEAKARSAICASPINAKLEVSHLRAAGQTPVSEKDFELTEWHAEKIKSLQARLSEIL